MSIPELNDALALVSKFEALPLFIKSGVGAGFAGHALSFAINRETAYVAGLALAIFSSDSPWTSGAITVGLFVLPTVTLTLATLSTHSLWNCLFGSCAKNPVDELLKELDLKDRKIAHLTQQVKELQEELTKLKTAQSPIG